MIAKPTLTDALAWSVSDFIEEHHREIADALLRSASGAETRSFARSFLAGAFIDQIAGLLHTGDDAQLMAWVTKLAEDSDVSSDVSSLLVSGCAGISAAYAPRGREAAAVVQYFTSLAVEVETAFTDARLRRGSQQRPQVEVVPKEDVIAGLVAVLEARDSATCAHSRAVASWSARIARAMRLSDETVSFVEICGLLHDIGKLSTPEGILLKPGPLDADEWTIMREHSASGAAVLEQIGCLRACAPVVRAHHEWFNGNGYPDRLVGAQIPVGARIVAVADSFHAMISRRPYRAAVSPSRAIATLREGRGSQWDPHIIDVMLSLTAASPATQAVPMVNRHIS